MIAIVALVVAVVVIALSRGSFHSLAQLRLRHEVPLVILFLLQGLLRGRFPLVSEVPGLAVVGWALACVISILLLWPSRRLPGVPLIVIGIMMNLLVVLANGAMPVGGSGVVESAYYTAASSAHVLTWLGDVLPLPGGWILSLGDLVLMVGMVTLLVAGSAGVVGERSDVGRADHGG